MRPEIVARMVVSARKQGRKSTLVGKHTFNLIKGGMCSRFARQATEESMGTGEGGMASFGPNTHDPKRPFACCAAATEVNLRQAGYQVPEGGPGDVVCFNNPPAGGKCSTCGRTVGHIGIYLGGGQVAENTSSGKRGDPRKPGTKISPLDEIGPSRVSGYYRVVASVPAGDPLIVLLPGSTEILCRARVESDVTRCDLRLLAEALGYEVIPHLEDEGKVYLRPLR